MSCVKSISEKRLAFSKACIFLCGFAYFAELDGLEKGIFVFFLSDGGLPAMSG